MIQFYLRCDHKKPRGQTRCQEPGCPASTAAYLRQHRATVEPLGIRKARQEGGERLRALLLQRFEGDLGSCEFNGFAVAEIIREIGWNGFGEAK